MKRQTWWKESTDLKREGYCMHLHFVCVYFIISNGAACCDIVAWFVFVCVCN